MAQTCEHCGKSDERPIVVDAEGGERTFCSAECVASTEKQEKMNLWKALVRQRDALLREMEEKRDSKVITMIHREEMHNGEDQYITIDNTEELLRKILAVPQDTPIDFIIHCPGGVALSAEQIALALREHKSKVTAIVPYYAMSGATLVCLAAGEIMMEPFSVLGPLDPQIAEFPSPSLIRLVEVKGAQYVSDQMVLLSDIAEKSLRQMKSFVQYLLKGRLGEAKARGVAEFLTGGYLTHDAPLTATELQSLGLEIVMNVPEDVHAFMKLHKLVSVPLTQGGHGAGQNQTGSPKTLGSILNYQADKFR